MFNTKVTRLGSVQAKPATPNAIRRTLLTAAGATLLAQPAFAQAKFPSRPIRIIVPWLPSAAADLELRALAQAASGYFGEAVVIENKAGASGTLGAQLLASETKSDGYLLTQMHSTIFRVAGMVDKPTYDVMNDYSWILQLVGYSYGVVVRADSPWQTFGDLLAYVKANPGKLTLGTAGVGTTQHITMTQVATQQGLEWLHVPFRGGGDDVQALLGGQIMAVASSTLWGELVQSGKLRLLVTFGKERIKRFPEAPTLIECGINIAQTSPYGLVAPKNLDPNIKQILHDGFKKALYTQSHLDAIARLDMPVQYMDSAEYEVKGKELFQKEMAAVRQLGIRLN
jgi:tripartite-type tricarboxylate transporter receptor subunit TctC